MKLVFDDGAACEDRGVDKGVLQIMNATILYDSGKTLGTFSVARIDRSQHEERFLQALTELGADEETFAMASTLFNECGKMRKVFRASSYYGSTIYPWIKKVQEENSCCAGGHALESLIYYVKDGTLSESVSIPLFQMMRASSL